MGEPVFYRWDGVGLSVVTGENLVTYRAADIEPFAIHNQQYVAVANYVNDHDVYHLDSKLYMCNALSGRFNSLQKLWTDGAVDFEFFRVGQSLSQEYFSEVANQLKILPSSEEK